MVLFSYWNSSGVCVSHNNLLKMCFFTQTRLAARFPCKIFFTSLALFLNSFDTKIWCVQMTLRSLHYLTIDLVFSDDILTVILNKLSFMFFIFRCSVCVNQEESTAYVFLISALVESANWCTGSTETGLLFCDFRYCSLAPVG